MTISCTYQNNDDSPCLTNEENGQINLYACETGTIDIGNWSITGSEPPLPGIRCFQFFDSQCDQQEHSSENCKLRRMFRNIETISQFLRSRFRYQPSSYTASINRQITIHDRQNNGSVTPYAAWLLNEKQVIVGNYDIHLLSQSPDVYLDVIAHEFFHGLISHYYPTFSEPNLNDSLGESQALEESLCDIFAVLVRNLDNRDISRWNWKIGQGFTDNGDYERDLSQFRSISGYNQNTHNIYDYSLIHSHGFYKLINSTEFSFTSQFADNFFCEFISRFIINREEDELSNSYQDSRKIMLEIAKKFHSDSLIRAIGEAFEAVGID